MMRIGTGAAALLGFGLLLTGCGTSGNNIFSGSSLDLFRTSSKATAGTADNPNTADIDVECPGIDVRIGASTLTIGSKPGDAEPSALDLRYQGSIIRTARECHVNAGVMSMKVGIEGRIITGPAGGPGTVDVPIRIAVVHEGVNPKTIVSKFARVPVTVNSSADRVTFTHIDSEIAFPMPQPAADIDSYIVYVGFDSMGAPPDKKKPPAKGKPAAKKKPATKPSQS